MSRSGPRLDVGIHFPGWVLNKWSIKAFNALYHRRTLRERTSGRIHLDSFFYPLDFVLNWNRIYGRKGFVQYQCVLPHERGAEGLLEFVGEMRQAGGRPYLAVLKDFGRQGDGLLSFPRPGFTLALDFPVDARTQGLVDRLNDVVLRQGGRIYLAKDAFSRQEQFVAMEPRLEEWQRVRRQWDPQGRIRSRQSVRLLGDEA